MQEPANTAPASTDKAAGQATQAQAKRNADDADKAAAAAQASADEAKDKMPAATARGAGHLVNYPANEAVEAARSASDSSYSASVGIQRASLRDPRHGQRPAQKGAVTGPARIRCFGAGRGVR